MAKSKKGTFVPAPILGARREREISQIKEELKKGGFSFSVDKFYGERKGFFNVGYKVGIEVELIVEEFKKLPKISSKASIGKKAKAEARARKEALRAEAKAKKAEAKLERAKKRAEARAEKAIAEAKRVIGYLKSQNISLKEAGFGAIVKINEGLKHSFLEELGADELKLISDRISAPKAKVVKATKAKAETKAEAKPKSAFSLPFSEKELAEAKAETEAERFRWAKKDWIEAYKDKHQVNDAIAHRAWLKAEGGLK